MHFQSFSIISYKTNDKTKAVKNNTTKHYFYIYICWSTIKTLSPLDFPKEISLLSDNMAVFRKIYQTSVIRKTLPYFCKIIFWYFITVSANSLLFKISSKGYLELRDYCKKDDLDKDDLNKLHISQNKL